MIKAESVIYFIKNWWFLFALIMSLYWGLRSAYFFTTDPLTRISETKQEMFFFRRRWPRLGTFLIATYQFMFYFVGSFAGWFCLYVLLIRVESKMPSFRGFNIGDVILFIFSLVGITGHLPKFILGFAESSSKAADLILRLMKK